jgi:hypothetical protein
LSKPRNRNFDRINRINRIFKLIYPVNPVNPVKNMKKFLTTLFLVFLALPLHAEVRLSIKTEFYNTFTTLSGLDDWRYFQSGTAGVAFQNKGSRLVRGELSLDFDETGGSSHSITLKRLYIRPSFGNVLVSLGKTRSTWGAGFAFNAGDLIFGSDSVDFDAKADDPRTETAWLTNAEIPLGDFSFLEIIALPGNVDEGELPPLKKASAGARISVEVGDFNIQTGYLYRGDLIADLGSEGQRAFLSLEGISPINWHLSSSTTTGLGGLSTETIKQSWMITGGAFYDHTVNYDKTLSWQVEFLLKPFASFEVDVVPSDSDQDQAAVYGLYLYPSISFAPRGNLVYSLNSVISPIDLSANTTLGVNWNIYEALSLQAYYSVQSGESGDVFHIDKPGGMSCTIGAKYTY